MWGIRGLDRSLLVVGGLWLGLVAVSTLVYIQTGRHINTCLFRFASGYPCVACGGTRALLSLARGDVAGAWRLNPLVTVVLCGLPVYVLWWRAVGRRGHRSRPLPRGVRVSLFAITFVALGVNWWYVITHLPALERPLTQPAVAP